jgi:alanine racemase
MNFARRCWAEINMDALKSNFELIKSCARGAKVMAVVKANCYGHGDEIVAKMYDENGADAFAVALPDEGARLRGFGIKKPVLILGYSCPEDVAKLAQLDLTQTVFSLDYARQLLAAAEAAGVTVKCHLKFDTGMGRIGFTVRDGLDAAVAQAMAVCELPALQIDGAFMHFCVADSIKNDNKAFTAEQYEMFCEAVDLLEKARGKKLETVHCCNSAGIFMCPDYHLDMVRPGIILYGEQPSDEVALDDLTPAMQLKAHVAYVKTLEKGDTVSYGRTFTATRRMKIATITVGYADGYPRLLSGSGVFEINGKPAPVLGRVCMDQTMVDVSDIPNVREGDAAIVMGGTAGDSVNDVAHKAGTISYEILCNISRRVRRVYLEGGQEIAERDYLK